MALPHLRNSLYTTRKNIYEAAIVHRRVKEDGFRETWDNHSKYFSQENVKATKQSAWESEKSFNHSEDRRGSYANKIQRPHSGMEAWKIEQEKEMKKIRLLQRRSKLSNMLEEERKRHAAELSGLSGDNYARLEDMKQKTQASKTARERERKQLAEDLLYEHWRSNTPEVRNLEFKQHKEYVVNEWGDQVAERRQREEEERAQKEREERELEEQRQRAVELEYEQERDRIEEEVELKRVLKEQMMELKEREEEASFLKHRQDDLLREQWELDQLESERKQREEERKKQEHGRILLRQHTAALRRKSQQIQQQLEEDRQFLQQLLEREKEDQRALSSRREKAKADAHWMKSVIEEQIKVEKQREADLDMLYQDEAARMWQKREDEWAKEKLARERLMKEVLDDRRQQVAERMEVLAEEQQESLQRREELLQELEFAQQMTRREQEEEEEAKHRRKQELESQMSARTERNRAAQSRLEEELAAEEAAEQDYDKMLEQEAQRMKLGGFTPRAHPRKAIVSARSHRQAWN